MAVALYSVYSGGFPKAQVSPTRNDLEDSVASLHTFSRRGKSDLSTFHMQM